VSLPEGMANWTAPGFDAAKAGWKSGLPPFGQLDGKLAPLRTCTRDGGCGCGEKPNTLWEKEVLLMRGTFELPPLRDGCRYRLMVGGSNHVNSGEGFAIHINGKLLAESDSGVPNRAGGQPRGAHVYADCSTNSKVARQPSPPPAFCVTDQRRAATSPSGSKNRNSRRWIPELVKMLLLGRVIKSSVFCLEVFCLLSEAQPRKPNHTNECSHDNPHGDRM
jgi:hypothetical protein